jgi:D-lyxose ketol-isomerase
MAHEADALQLQGPRREAALAAFEKQIAQWGIKMPPVERLVLDFGVNDFDHIGLIECWLANELRAGYCGKYLFTFAGQECPSHSHSVKHETFCALKGRLRITLDGKPHILEEGETLPVAPGQVHSFRGEDGNALLIELSMPCDPKDNNFVDPRIRQWLHKALGIN